MSKLYKASPFFNFFSNLNRDFFCTLIFQIINIISMQKKLTEGNITTKILSFAFPVLLGNAFQRFYTLADTIMVGQLLGTGELAAVGASSVIANLFNDICNSFTMGFAIIIAQYYGANQERNMKKALAGTYSLVFALAALFTIFGSFIINPILHATKVPAEIFDNAALYLKIIVSGLIASAVYNSLAHILRAFGDSTIPLIFLIISVSLNIILDYSFIQFLHLGVAGVAIATVVSQGVAGFGCLIFCIFKRKLLHVTQEDFKEIFAEKGKVFAALLPQGLSMCFMLSLVSLSTVILQTGINSLGSEVIAGYMAGRKYIELFMMPGAALSMTSAPFVSQNFGANKPDRIRKGVFQMYCMGWIWSAFAFVFIFIFGRSLIISVTGKNAAEEIIRSGILYLRISISLFAPLIVLVVTRSALQGMNHKKTPVFSSCIEVAVKVLSVFLFVPKLGFLGICITEPIIWILGACWVYPVYRHLRPKD